LQSEPKTIPGKKKQQSNEADDTDHDALESEKKKKSQNFRMQVVL
jgi:hypothetical protein